MKIRNTFLNLTDHLYPHGSRTEATVEDFKKRAKRLFEILPKDLIEDEYGNLYKVVGDGTSTMMFTCHLDTATMADGPVKHVIETDTNGDEIIKTDGTSILGADDKAGTVIMMNMMENNVPGLYYFFLGEEVGCLGSKWLDKKLNDDKWIEQDLYKNVKKVISFDRKGYDSVISYQTNRSASDKFCDELAKRLNALDKTFKYKNDPTGRYTDSGRLAGTYPECTNISVGYKDEHKKSEQQNMTFLLKLADACVKLDWETLPVKRDPKVDNESRYGYSNNSYNNYRRNNANTNTSTNHKSYNTYSSKSTKDSYESEYIYDEKYEYVIEIEIKNKSIVDITMCQERLDWELSKIKEMMNIIGISYSTMKWDGVDLSIKTSSLDKVMSRDELYEFLPELDYIANLD